MALEYALMLVQCLGNCKIQKKWRNRNLHGHSVWFTEKLWFQKMSLSLNIVLNTLITAVNYIKLRPLQSRVYSALWKNIGAVYSTLLFYCEAKWKSRGKCLQRVYQLFVMNDNFGTEIQEYKHILYTIRVIMLYFL